MTDPGECDFALLLRLIRTYIGSLWTMLLTRINIRVVHRYSRYIYFPRVPRCVSPMMRGRVESHGRRSYRKPLSSVSPGGFKSRLVQIKLSSNIYEYGAIRRVQRFFECVVTSPHLPRRHESDEGGIDADEDAVLRLRRHAPAVCALWILISRQIVATPNRVNSPDQIRVRVFLYISVSPSRFWEIFFSSEGSLLCSSRFLFFSECTLHVQYVWYIWRIRYKWRFMQVSSVFW